MELKIRSVEEKDLEDIRQLNKASWLEAYKDIIPEEKMRDGIKYPCERLMAKLEDEKLLFLVAEIDGKVIGSINFCWGRENTHEFVDTEKDQAQLRSVYIHPEYWNKGVGTKLFLEGKKQIPDTIEELRVESLSQNKIGRGFYDKLGFETVKEGSIELFGDIYPTVIQVKKL